ncbi:MAG: glycosyltransferase [Oscillospiraceae bacterium]
MEPDSICVLLSTYNGEKYLEQQVDSILNQLAVNVSIYIRDDGSIDKTTNILKKYSDDTRIQYAVGANIGYAKSFLWLVANAPKADYYAFADQDDVWNENKLYNAIRALKNTNAELYASALDIVDADLSFIRRKNFDGMPVTLGSNLCRNRLAGCTMVFSKDIQKAIRQNGMMSTIFSHDQWVFLTAAALNKSIYVDQNSYIQYRRHATTVTVASTTLRRRICMEIRTIHMHVGSNAAKSLLDAYKEILSEESYEFISKIMTYKESIGNTIKLVFDKRLDCGIAIANIETRIAILLHTF